ncbi:NADAR family protein [uncultured Chryseobacterium sp.]|uniref:NADAR family protein n=1 Tax=uncultured Chryseobacterium sp. TaxID=259322 RepID=UPI0025DA9839|nr:NADAR family protein [uncultured Chryseobacterium sp.]
MKYTIQQIIERFQLWDEHKYEIVKQGNLLKFSQNEKLKEFLLSTEDKVLVEASPYDTIWGIGMPETNPKAGNPSEWNGENLLGFALMEVRDELKR